MIRLFQKTPLASSGSTSGGYIILFLLFHLVAQINILKQKLDKVSQEYEQLKSKLRLRESQLFGRKSEK